MTWLPETWLPETPLTPPPGRKLGALTRNDRPGENCGYWAEQSDTYIIPQEEWGEWIEAGIDLRKNCNMVFDQNGIGSCAAEGACGALDITRDVAGLPFVEFSPLFTYHTTSGGSDRGSTLNDNLRELKTTGACPEAIWPRSKGFRAKPSEEAYEAAKAYRIVEYYEIRNWLEMGSAMLQRFPVYAAYAGHAWVALKPVNTRQLTWRNSWGTSWGDGGYGVLNASRVQFSYGIYAIRTATEAD